MEPFILIGQGVLKLNPGNRIIRACDYSSRLTAKKMLSKAREEARAIENRAKADVEAQKKLGYQAGFDFGKKEASKYMVEMVARTAAYLSEHEEKITDLVISALRKIVGDMDGQHLTLSIIKNALYMVSKQEHITIRVAPSKVDMVHKSVSTLTSQFPCVKLISVVGDKRMVETDCELETSIGKVQASLEAQLDVITSCLAGSFKKQSEKMEKCMAAVEQQVINQINDVS